MSPVQGAAEGDGDVAARARTGLALMFASGFAALGYQIVWTQQAGLWLGHEAAGVLAVLAAFFGGLAVGALSLGRRIERSTRPERGYAACEAVIAAWSLVLALLMVPVGRALLELIGLQPSPLRHWSIAFAGTFLLLLPATAAMGATLPAIAQMLAGARSRTGAIGALYAANTLGGVVGVLTCAFWLVPALGLLGTASVCAAMNVFCAVAAFTLRARSAERAVTLRAGPGPRLAAMLAVTGFLGIGYEVLAVRVLAHVTENTVYTFAMLLAVYLVGAAIGAALYQRTIGRTRTRRRAPGVDRLLRQVAGACVLGALGLAAAPHLRAWALVRLPANLAGVIASEALLAIAAFLLPTMAMGALFTHLCRYARATPLGVGGAVGVNTLGAAGAPIVFGVVLAPRLGTGLALAALLVGYLALASRRAWSSPTHWSLAAAVAGLALLAPRLAVVDVPEGGRLVARYDGPLATVSVIEDRAGTLGLHIDNGAREGSNATLFADARQALLPVLLHPSPQRALFLGLGSGVTASAGALDPELAVEAVELLPEVVAASAHFAPDAFPDASRRLDVKVADARRFVRVSAARYDVVIADNFQPARSGSAALYTVEHFAAVGDRLAPGGVFCQWLPLHQLDLETLRSIVAAFIAVFPEGRALLATNSLETPVLGLVASDDPLRLEPASVRQRLAAAARWAPLDTLALDSELALLGSFVAGPAALTRFARGAPRNSDDHPIVAYIAPRLAHRADSRPRDRLLALLEALDREDSEPLLPGVDPGTSQRLAAYRKARRLFLAAGRDVAPTADVRKMLAQVRDPLLAVLAVSPEFRPAYDPLLAMAKTLARSDPAQARALLEELQRLDPARAETGRALRELQRD